MTIAVRGPGSNQHADKPPVSPRDATGVPVAAVGALAVEDPLAQPESPLPGMDPVEVDGQIIEYRSEWSDETHFTPNGDPQNEVAVAYGVEVVARPVEDEDDSGMNIYDVEVRLYGGQESHVSDVFETSDEVGTPTFEAKWNEWRDDLVKQAEHTAEFPERDEPDYDEPDYGWERY